MRKRPAGIESFVGNKGSIQRKNPALYAKKRTASRGNGTRTNSSESQEGAKASVYLAGASHHKGTSMAETESDSQKIDSWG
jgi:hypothetical protein